MTKYRDNAHIAAINAQPGSRTLTRYQLDLLNDIDDKRLRGRPQFERSL